VSVPITWQRLNVEVKMKESRVDRQCVDE
jgi:hypothetical protein